MMVNGFVRRVVKLYKFIKRYDDIFVEQQKLCGEIMTVKVHRQLKSLLKRKGSISLGILKLALKAFAYMETNMIRMDVAGVEYIVKLSETGAGDSTEKTIKIVQVNNSVAIVMVYVDHRDRSLKFGGARIEKVGEEE